MVSKRELENDVVTESSSLIEKDGPRKGLKSIVEGSANIASEMIVKSGNPQPLSEMGEFEDAWEDEMEGSDIEDDSEEEVIFAEDSEDEDDDNSGAHFMIFVFDMEI